MSYKEGKVNLSNDMLFGLVMEKEHLCRQLLERLLGFPIKKVRTNLKYLLQDGLNFEGVRLDVYANDENGTKYDVKLQIVHPSEIGCRFRYYQSKVDYDLIGRSIGYMEPQNTIIIFICTFDPFDQGLYRYTFVPGCLNMPKLDLRTKQKWILYNTSGEKGDVTEAVKQFLKYVADSRSVNATDPFLKEVNDAISVIMESKIGADVSEYAERLKEIGDIKLEEGMKRGRVENTKNLILKVCRKLERGKTVQQSADELMEDIATIENIVSVAREYAPDYDIDAIYERIKQGNGL